MNHTDVVVAQKKVCEDLGLDLTGPNCFEITKRVAWALRSENAGLLDKPSGNNKDGYAVDIICYPDGQLYDILVNSGGLNAPAWQDAGHADASRYRAPIVMELPPVINGGGDNPPPANPDLNTRMVVALESIAETLKQLAAKVL